MQEVGPLRWMSTILLFDRYPEAIFWVALEGVRSRFDVLICRLSTCSQLSLLRGRVH